MILYVAAINKEFEQLGFVMSKDLMVALCKKSLDEVTNFHHNVIKQIKVMTGADVKYKPMYQNFPEEVENIPEMELYIRAVIHYIGWDSFIEMPSEPVEDKLPIIDAKSLKVIDLGNEKDEEDMIRDLFAMPISYSDQDKKDIATIIKKRIDFSRFIPNPVTNKENLVSLTMAAWQVGKGYEMLPLYRTATDVRRLYAGMSNGDISLAAPVKFRNLSRPECKLLLELLDKTKDLEECMKKDPVVWKNIMKRLRVSEYPRYRSVSQAYDKLYNDKLPQTFMGKYMEKIYRGDIVTAAKLLSNRPGELARNMDTLLRNAKTIEDKARILILLSNVSGNISVPVLLQLRSHFQCRTETQNYRVAFPKGNVAKAYIYEGKRDSLDAEIVTKVVAICDQALQEKFKEKGNMGKVYIDSKLEKFKAPLVLRNTSKAVRTVPRGSRFKVDEKANKVRAFIWWGNNIDNDLSAVFLDKNMNYASHISYTNLKNNFGVHSGDFTHWRSEEDKRNGLCEFVDINLNEIEKHNIGYVVMEVHNFTGEPFAKSPCRFGYMERDGITGQLFEPKTVENICDLTSMSTSVASMIYDVENREFIWSDIAINPNQLTSCHNVENSLGAAKAAVYACVHSEAPDLYSAIMANVIAREGELVLEPDQADYVFTSDVRYHNDKNQVVITPFDTEKILASVISEEKDPYAIPEKEKTLDEIIEEMLDKQTKSVNEMDKQDLEI